MNLQKIVVFSRLLEFYLQKMIETFNFHNYDSLLHADTKKIDPRKRGIPNESELIVEMMFATKKGDIDSVRRYCVENFYNGKKTHVKQQTK